MALHRTYPHGHMLVLVTLACCMRAVTSRVLLSEVNADNPGQMDMMEFIELYNDAVSPTALADHVLVLYDGADNRAYGVIPLKGGTISPYGYYIIGSDVVVPTPDKLLDSNLNILQNGVDAVALYRGDTSLYSVGMAVTNESLVDALVYDKRGRTSSPLLDILTPGGLILDEWPRHLSGGRDESISRCRGLDPLMPSQFQLTPLTPGAPNNCTPDEVATATPAVDSTPGGFPNLPSFPPDVGDIFLDIIINEFSVDAELGQFVELYDGGVGDMILDGLFLVMYRGRTEASYGQPIDLAGYRTDEQGYFLIGHSSLQPDAELQRPLRTTRPPNAIALHFGEAADYVPSTPVSGDNLVDAVVYGDSQEANALLAVFIPGGSPLVRQDGIANTSFSRCRSFERLRLAAFVPAIRTPGGDNLCRLPDLVINEVNVVAHGEPTQQFVEVFDGGVGQQSLDGVVVVFYEGQSSESYLAVDLTGYSTDVRGFCVVGWTDGPGVDVGMDFDPTVGFLRETPSAVALHLGPPGRFRSGRSATDQNLIDAVVYGQEAALDLLHALMPFQHVLNELGGGTPDGGDQSISRCSCCQRLDSGSFGVGPASPGSINTDCRRDDVTHIESLDHYTALLRINEVRIVSPGQIRGDFVEIYLGGFAGSQIPLTNMVLVLYSSEGESSYKTINLDGFQTDSNGFFVIGARAVQPTVSIVEDTHWFQGGGGAVALHKGSPEDFPDGTSATSVGLVDAVVYGDNNLLLLDLLTLGQSYVNYSTVVDATSILRCYSRDALDGPAFSVGESSPGSANVCPPPPVVFNEVNVLDLSGGVGQYVELSTLGVPQFPLNDLLMIFWKGIDESPPWSYRTLAINGRRTDNNGLFLIGYKGLSSPRPDMVPFNVPTGKIKEGDNAISLHRGLRREDFPSKSPPTTAGLVDVIVHSSGEGSQSARQGLLDVFQPRVRLQMGEDTTWSQRDESINRCPDAENRTIFTLAHVTPKAHNHCPLRPGAGLVINELGLIPSEQFVELWDLGAGFTSLDDFVVVLFGEGDQSYWTIPLTGFSTDSMGYFLMGTTTISPPAHFQFANGFMRSAYGAVALYRVSTAANSFPDGAQPSPQGLIDAVVYTDQDAKPRGLTDVLASKAVDSRDLQASGFALSRCLSGALLSPRPFLVQPATPRSFNDCPVYPEDVVLSEVNAEHPGQALEFVELYDGGVGGRRLSYLTLVAFSSHNADHVYLTLDLHGKRTDSRGYFVIGGQGVEGANLVVRTRYSGGFLQDGAGAIALYRAPEGAFPYGAEPTTRSLVDAIVYSNDERDHITLVDKLIPGQSAIVEDHSHAPGDETIVRCRGNQRLSSDAFSIGWPTPGQDNNCSSTSTGVYQGILINEVNTQASAGGGEFIELWDGGGGRSPLTGFLLVLFNGANQDRSYLEIDLAGYSTNTRGYFVVGTAGVSPRPGIVVPDGFIQDGPDAVALYHTRARLFPRGTIATGAGLVDVLIYSSSGGSDGQGTSSNEAGSLVAKLAPGQQPATEYAAYTDGDESLSRCHSNQSAFLSAFIVAEPTPGQPNACSGTPLVISEIKLSGDTPGFIELYDGGRGSTSLDGLSLTLYDSGGQGVYFTQALTGKSTNSNGYFVMGQPSSKWTVDLEVVSSSSFLHSSGYSAVALYKDTADSDSSADSRVLIDALVYGSRNPPMVAAIQELAPGQDAVRISPGFGLGTAGISRCDCCQPLMMAAFAPARPTPGRENLGCPAGGGTATTAATPTDIVVNEVSPRTGGPGTERGEYVELRGPPGASLMGITLVLSSTSEAGPVVYFTLALDQWSVSLDGFFVIGSMALSPDLALPASPEPVLRAGEGAVAIYRNAKSALDKGSPVTSTDLVDALVYTNDTKPPNLLASALKPGLSSIFTGNFSPVADVTAPSISRCTCCDSLDPSSFTLSARTPGRANRCPARAYRRTVQLHILDASYEVWVTNRQLTGELREQIAAGVNALCKCGFSANYLRDEKLLNGSVYYQADMYALSPSHSTLLYDSYVNFVRKTQTVKVMGTEFHIDNACFSDCLAGPANPEGRTGSQGVSAAAPVAIVIVVVVLAALIAAALYFVRHRTGKLSFFGDGRRSPLDVDGEFRVSRNWPLADLDILGKSSHRPSESFDNPVYLPEAAKAPAPGPGPSATAGPAEGVDARPANGEGSETD